MTSAPPAIRHIVTSPSAAVELRAALRRAGRRDPVVGLTDPMAMGPIDPPSPSGRLRWAVEELGVARDDWDWLPGHLGAFWRRTLAPAARRIVWASSRNANEWCGFLAVLERLGDAPLELVDLAEVEVAVPGRGGLSRYKPRALGMLHPETIAREQLWDLARPLSAPERGAHLATWATLKAENAPLRIIGPEGLRSAPLTAFDAQLLSQATDDWHRATWVVGSVLMDDDLQFFQVGDLVLAQRLATLIEEGRLDSRPAPRPTGAAQERPPDRFWVWDVEVRRPAGSAAP